MVATATARPHLVRGLGGMGPFLFAAAAMFTAMYSTQAILPELGREFDVSPSQTGLTVSVVIGALAVGAWFWGPLSDRIGRRASLVLSSAVLVVPSIGLAFAPSFGVLLALRVAQGLCMPGLLTVGVPYVTEAYTERIGTRAMGLYVSALVVGGLVGRVGVALLTAATSWRVALGAVAALPLAATLVMRRSLPPETAVPSSAGLSLRTLRATLANRALVAATLTGSAMFFSFMGIFSYVDFRLERAPFSLSPAVIGLIFVLWAMGVVGPLAGATDRDRGLASAMYFSAYYVAGALGAYVPGLAWQSWHWTGVWALTAAAYAIGFTAIVATRATLTDPRAPSPADPADSSSSSRTAPACAAAPSSASTGPGASS
jgi:YNFM family putative membrane transporter